MSTSSNTGKFSGQKIRLGFFEDFSTAPVVAGLESAVRGSILRRAELQEVKDLCKKGDLDAALLPTSSALRMQNSSIIPASVVAAVGASRMFFLVSKKLPTEIVRVLVDSPDMGGEMLGRLVLAKKLMIRPEFIRSDQSLDPAKYDFTQDDGYDAYLLQGRNCYSVRKDVFAFTMDLTFAWFEMSRLPYVIHAWVVRKGHVLGTLEKELSDVAHRNENNRDLITRTAERSQMSESGVRAVYEKAFQTRFDASIIASLRQYAKELVQGRIVNVPPITVYTPPATMRRAGAT